MSLSCISFTNSYASRGFAFYSKNLLSYQISCGFCFGNSATFHVLDSLIVEINSVNTSYSKADLQTSCFSLSPLSSFDVKFLTCTHSTEKSGASFPLYRGCGSFSYVNTYNITTTNEESSGFIVIGFGVGITFLNSSFHHSGHKSIFSLYKPMSNETVIIRNCRFVSPLKTFSIDCVETSAVTFASIFSYVQYEIGSQCKQPPHSHNEPRSMKKSIFLQIAFFVFDFQ